MRTLLFVLMAGTVARLQAAPPVTEEKAVRETLHGVEIVDPYRWLEGNARATSADTADAALDARVAAWTDAQNAYSRSMLDRLPGRKELEARLRELAAGGFRWEPRRRGEHLFYWEASLPRQQPVFIVEKSGGGTPRVLLDPATIDPSGLTTIAWATPSPDGILVALGTFRAGDENATLNLVETETGVWRADEIRNKVREVSWLPDGSGFVYNNLEDVANPSSRRIRFHRLGTHPREDKLLLAQATEGPAAATWGPFGHLSPDGRWLLLGQWTGSGINDLWVMDFARWLKTGEAERRPIFVDQEGQAGLPDVYEAVDPIRGDTLYMTINLNAPNRRVVAVDLNDPDPKKWRQVIPEKKDAALQRLTLAGDDTLIAEYLANASSRIERYGLDGTPRGELPLPGLGTAGLSVSPDGVEGFLDYSSFNEPPSIYRVDLKTGERKAWWRSSVPVDPTAIEVRQAWYPSKDGTRVSMFLIHKKGLPLDGCRPTQLYGYGGFGISLTPGFDTAIVPWIEAGGVYAMANLRGGGEYGEAWHQAGMLERKQNVFDDFIAAALWLVESGYTRPERLGIVGGSNGGLLVGAALTQRPDLFSAAVAQVPILDMTHYHELLRARNWISEYGSSDDPAQLAYLLRYSPYQNVKSGTRYPAVLMTAGERDERVHPLHARKMTALLQKASASDPETKPILLLVDRDGGHGGGTPADKQIHDLVDQISFLGWQLGLGKACPDR